MDNISLFELEDTGVSNQEIVPLIIRELEEKYNNRFLVKCIGERYGTDTFDEATAYCSPIENEKLVFTVKFDMIEEKLIDDDYYTKKNCFELEENIEAGLKQNGIEALNKAEIFGKNKIDENITVDEFSKKYTKANYISTIIIKNSQANKNLEDSFKYIRDKFEAINLKTLIYIIDENDYDIFTEQSKLVPYFSTTFIEKYNVIEKHNISVNKNQIIKIK